MSNIHTCQEFGVFFYPASLPASMAQAALASHVAAARNKSRASMDVEYVAGRG
jgi:hypothetical protein